MKKTLIKFICTVIAALSALTFFACGKELDFTMETEIIEAEDGKSVTYKYTYVNIDDMPKANKKELEKQLNKDDIKNTVDGLLVVARTEDPEFESITYAYYESDGDVIATKTFK